MKLTHFSQQTFPKQNPGGRVKLPMVSFGKAGAITFNRHAVALMGLSAKDKVTLAQDPEAPENWYFFKDAQHGFGIRPEYKGLNMRFQHAALVKAFMEAIGKETGSTMSFKLAGKPTVVKGDKTEYWGILIS